MEAEYQFEARRYPEQRWSELLRDFSDSSLYQAFSYGAVRWGEDQLEHAVLRQGGEIVSACQLRIIGIPWVGGGIAYASRGPVWRTKGRPAAPRHFAVMVQQLRAEFSVRRGHLLRLNLNEAAGDMPGLEAFLGAGGLRLNSRLRPYRTFRIDLNPPLESIRKQMKSGWRYNLGKAERAGLRVVESTDLELYDAFLQLYEEMHDRKGFSESVDVREFRRMQARLPADLKMTTVLALQNDRPIAAVVWTGIGASAIPIFSAASPPARKCFAAYLLRWHVLKRARERGCTWFDQGGVNPDANPGGYQFKSGMGGGETTYVGQFETCAHPMSNLILRAGETLKLWRQHLLRRRSRLVLPAATAVRDEPEPVKNPCLQEGGDQ